MTRAVGREKKKKKQINLRHAFPLVLAIFRDIESTVSPLPKKEFLGS